jgi:hypothetical protein
VQQYRGYRYRPFDYPRGEFDLGSFPEENQLRLFRFNASEYAFLHVEKVRDEVILLAYHP